MTPSIGSTDLLALRCHEGQLYGAEPYVNHVRRVAGRIRDHGQWAYMAGLLHDVVEDTETTLDDLRRLGYPRQVVEAVDAVTRRDGETYHELICRAASHPLGCLVKLADNRENVAHLPELARTDPERATSLGKRYAKAWKLLKAAMFAHQAWAQQAGVSIGGPPLDRRDDW